MIGAMPPKAKGKAKAKAKAKAAPKVLARPAARVVGKARNRGRGLLKKPAARGQSPGKQRGESQPWWNGGVAQLHQVGIGELLKTPGIASEEAKHYHSDCKLAGRILGLEMRGEEPMLRMIPTGTTSEALLRHSGSRDQEMWVHICPPGCNFEVVADYIAHGIRGRKLRDPEEEEAWTTNLLPSQPERTHDELANLTKRREEMTPVGPGGAKKEEAGEVKSDDEEAKDKKKKSKKEKKEKEKKEKKKKKKAKDKSSESVDLSGRTPRLASQKTMKALFSGRGLDPKEKVRMGVAKRARKVFKKAAEKDSSTSETGTDEETTDSGKAEEVEEGLLQQNHRVRRVAEACPGALTAQALIQMQDALLQSLGEDSPGEIQKGIPVQAVSREMQTSATALDLVIRAKPAQACDVLVQRLKSQETTASGGHWTVSQRMELLGPEQPSMAALPELREAQRDVWTESKMRQLTSQPDGRPKGKSKGQGKTDYYDKGKGADDRGRKGGKGHKNDGGKKKDEPRGGS